MMVSGERAGETGTPGGDPAAAAPPLPRGGLWIAAPHRAVLAPAGLDSIDAMLEARGEPLRKPGLGGRERLRVRVEDAGGAPRVYYLKRYPPPTMRFALRARCERVPPGGGGAWPHPRAWRDVWPTGELLAAGVATYEVAAWGWTPSGPRAGASAVLLAEIPAAISLERWVLDRWPHLDPPRRRRETSRLCRSVARLAARLHAAKLCHRDLYLCHLFLSGAVESRPRLHLIDLARVFRPPLRWERWRVKDLAALAASTPVHVAGPSLRARFLREYLREAMDAANPAPGGERGASPRTGPSPGASLRGRHPGAVHRHLARRVARKAAGIARSASRRREREGDP